MQSSANLGGREHRSPVDDCVTWTGEWFDFRTVADAADRASSAFDKWSKTTLETRIEFAKRYASYLQSNRPAIARTISLESGKPLWESDLEVQSAIAKVDNAIEAIAKRRWTTSEGAGSSFSTIRYKPLGMMVVLGPYNLPLHLPGAHIVPALLAGNTVLFKPSEKTPAVGDWIFKAWRSTGVPIGVVECIHGAVEQAKWAVDSETTAGVLFTGSYSAGKQLHKQLAGRPECMLALEMGGNNPLVIDRVENRQSAIVNIIQSAFITSGQRCTCARRLIIVNHPENAGLLEELSRSIDKILIGNPLSDSQPYMGSLVSRGAAEAILAAQAGLQSNGAIIMNEARLQSGSKAIVTPGLVLLSEASAVDEEYFGPLLTARIVED
jgi:succinylglutamic semialdehyde dehydrogenase